MLPTQFESFLSVDRYPKLFWEPAYQSIITLALGKGSPFDSLPLFYHGGTPQTFHPAWSQEFPSCPLKHNPLPQIIEKRHFPEYDGWQEIVDKALAMIDRGHLQKVVLARKTCLRFSSIIDPWSVFLRLRQNAAPSTTRFCLQYAKNKAFLGATPEKLFEREGLRLSTMALAGTAKCPPDSIQSAQLASALLASKKHRREVDLVVDFMANALSSFSQTLEIGPLEILKSTHVQHLHYSIKALLKEKITDEELIKALHPTPALGGLPREEALSFIEKNEPFSRGPYGAPIGFISQNKTDLAIAIRSAYVENAELHLFAGLGIVPGSNAREEWQELEDKLSPFMSFL